MNEKQISLLAAFRAAKVEFAVVGGVAVNAHGYVRACGMLGDMYLGGQGPPVNLAKALENFELSCAGRWGQSCAAAAMPPSSSNAVSVEPVTLEDLFMGLTQ